MMCKAFSTCKCANICLVILAISFSVMWVWEQHEIADITNGLVSPKSWLCFLSFISSLYDNQQISIFSSLIFCIYYVACKIIL